MSDTTIVRRERNGECRDCGAKKKVRDRRCPKCAELHAKKTKAERGERLAAGLCPRCGKSPPEAGAESCFRCGFGVAEGEVEDWVELMERHPRRWANLADQR